MFASADRIPLEPIPWMFVVPGLAIALFAGASLLLARRTAPTGRDARAARPGGGDAPPAGDRSASEARYAGRIS